MNTGSASSSPSSRVSALNVGQIAEVSTLARSHGFPSPQGAAEAGVLMAERRARRSASMQTRPSCRQAFGQGDDLPGAPGSDPPRCRSMRNLADVVAARAGRTCCSVSRVRRARCPSPLAPAGRRQSRIPSSTACCSGCSCPSDPVFVVHTGVVRNPVFRLLLGLVGLPGGDPTSPMASEAGDPPDRGRTPGGDLPEGRITTTGSLMKT